MIYMVASIILKPEKTMEFNDILEKEYLPIVAEHGSKLIACLRTSVGNVDEVTDIWAFESLSHLERVRQEQFLDPKYMSVRKKIRELMTAETIKLCAALPVSPLK